MMTLRELTDLLPQVFGPLLRPEPTSPRRRTPWIEAARLVHIGDFHRITDLYRFANDVLFPKLHGWTIKRRVARLLEANARPLQCISDAHHTLPFVVLPVLVADPIEISKSDYDVLESNLPPLLGMQYLGIEYVTWTGKYSEAIRQIPIAFNTAMQLMRSSSPGEAGRAGYFHLHDVFFAAAELTDHVGVGQCDVLGPLIGKIENAVPEPADFVRAQLLQFCANVLSAVQECPPTTEASELVRYFHEHNYLRAALYNWSDEEEDGPGASGSETIDRRHPSPEDGKRLRLVADRLLEGHRLPFDKAATIAELRDALAMPWSRLDMRPGDMRQMCTTKTRSGFYSDVHEAFAAVMMGRTGIGTREWRAFEANESAARRILADLPNPIGKAIVIEVTRVLFQQLQVIMCCCYNARLVQEVTRCLIGIKAFALRNGTLPSTMSDVVATEILGSLPEDPFSQTPLEYVPHRKLVRISPSADEIKEWQPAFRGRTWRLLK